MEVLLERELIEKAAVGDYRAFRVLVESFQGFVYSIAYRFVRDSDEAEDLTQEAFIRIWNNLNRYKPEFKLRTWIGKIITNLALDYLKSKRKKNERNRITMNPELDVTSLDHPEAEWESQELHQILLKLSEQLAPLQRAVFILRDMEQLDANEVCEILGMSAGNVKSNLYYARLHIKEGLEKQYKY